MASLQREDLRKTQGHCEAIGEEALESLSQTRLILGQQGQPALPLMLKETPRDEQLGNYA